MFIILNLSSVLKSALYDIKVKYMYNIYTQAIQYEYKAPKSTLNVIPRAIYHIRI